ncbi:MAG TPA: M56 family metallopeptidase, partial [Longimicrobiaceae bacterium]|nr:M56 family metallopeptidase [Longimicrobiaceae bacterium]
SWPGILLVVAVKATLLLLLAAALALALRRASAASRHLVWSLALAALLVLPPLSLLLPDWTVPLLTVQVRVDAADASWLPHVPAPAAAPEVLISPPVMAPVAPRSAPDAPAGWASPVHVEEMRTDPSTPSLLILEPHDASAPREAPGALFWLVALWAAGALLVLGRLLLGLLLARWIARRAQPVTDPGWLSLLQELSGRLELRRPVLLLRGERTSMPMACGLIWPAIVLPEAAERWSAERRRVVLLHELAHVRRHDCLTQALAQLACGLYWFHPGVWWVARRLRIERESACDDEVLSAGTRASVYAGHLLEVARAFRPSGLAAAAVVAMARPSQLEGRLLAVLDPARDRRTPPRNLGIVLGLLGICLLFPLAAMQPGLRAQESSAAESTLAEELALLTGTAGMRAGYPDLLLQERVIERSFHVEPGGTLTLELETGASIRVTGWDREQVFLRAELNGRDWQDTRVEAEETPGGVRIATSQIERRGDASTGHRLEIRVPHHFDIELTSSGGEVEVQDVRGQVMGRTGGGEIVLSRLHGSASLVTGGGEIHVLDSWLEGAVHTGGGDVVMRNVQGTLDASTGGGQVIRVEGAADSSGGPEGPVVRIDSPGGAITVQDAPAGAEVSTGGGAIYIGSARGFAHARTGGGSITLDQVDGPIKAITGAGAVAAAMVGDPARGGRDVEIRSGSGSVMLTLPAEISADFDIEVAHTDGAARPPRIVSDWDLSQTENVSRAGSGAARKHVRATGRAGDGRHRIHIRTVNGDVYLKRAESPPHATARGVWASAPAVTPAPHTPVVPTPPQRTSAESRVARAQAPESGFAFVTGSDRESRRRSVEMLGRNAPPPAAAAALERIAREDGDVRVQRQAVESLGTLRGEVGMAALIRIARTHPRVEVRREAVEALARIGCEQSIDALGDVIRRDPDVHLQRRSVEALGTVRRRASGDRSTEAKIRTVLERTARSHASVRVRAQAAEELTAFRPAHTASAKRTASVERTVSVERSRPVPDSVFGAALDAGVRAAVGALAAQ